MFNIKREKNDYIYIVGGVTVVTLCIAVCVLGEKLRDANIKAEASRLLLNRVEKDKFKYVCDTLSQTPEYEAYYKAYRIGDIVIE